MPDDPVAARYAQALFETARAEGTLDEALQQLEALGALIASSADLRQFLFNPDVEPADKIGLLDRVLQRTWSHPPPESAESGPPRSGAPSANRRGVGWSGLVRAFLLMVASMGRAEVLPQIAEALRAMADEAGGRMRVTVRSAHPISEAALERLRKTLQRRERKTITVETQLDPALLGGMQIRLDHRVIDGTARRQLDELRERLTSVRVA